MRKGEIFVNEEVSFLDISLWIRTELYFHVNVPGFSYYELFFSKFTNSLHIARQKTRLVVKISEKGLLYTLKQYLGFPKIWHETYFKTVAQLTFGHFLNKISHCAMVRYYPFPLPLTREIF